MQYQTKYPRLFPAVQWVAALSPSETEAAFEAWKRGDGSSIEAVANFCRGKNLWFLFGEAFRLRGAYREQMCAHYRTVWAGLGPVPLPRERIDAVFEKAEHQSEYILALLKIAIPVDWRFIKHVNGWPKVSHRTGMYILRKAQAFDAKHHPGVMAGGAWALGKGFSTAEVSEPTPDWTIDNSGVEIEWVA